MWLFRGLGPEGSPSDGADEETIQAQAHRDEKELLAEEAEELRLKLEALRMAEYREAQRAACMREGPGSSVPASSSAAAGEDATEPADGAEGAAVHFHIDDGDIESMYDFSDFVAETPPTAGGREEDADSSLDLEQLRMKEVRLQQRERKLQAQVDAQERKLAAASRALQKTRGQAQQLMDQLGSKDSQGSQLNVQAVQLERLLAEKERRLKAALDEAAAALTDEKHAETVEGAAAVNTEGVTQQPQEAPTIAGPRPPEPSTSVSEEHIIQLAALTEELTDALQQASESEAQTQRQLEEISARLEEERSQRLDCEHELNTAREAKDAEVNALLQRIQEQERSLAAEREHAKDLEARVRLADQLREAEEKRARGEVFYPHLEV